MVGPSPLFEKPDRTRLDAAGDLGVERKDRGGIGNDRRGPAIGPETDKPDREGNARGEGRFEKPDAGLGFQPGTPSAA